MKAANRKIEDASYRTEAVDAHFSGLRLARGGQWKALITLSAGVDTLMILVGFGLAYLVRFKTSLPVFQLDVLPSWDFYLRLMLALTLLWLGLYGLVGLYSRPNLLRCARQTALLANATTWGVFLVTAADFLRLGFNLARGWLLIAWVTTFLCTLAGRFVVRRGVRGLRRLGWFLSPAVIVGANREGRLLAEQLSKRPYSGLDLVGFVDESLPADTTLNPHLRVIGGLDCLSDLVRQNHVEEVILASSALSQSQLLAIFQAFGFSNQVNLRMSSGLYEIIATGFQVSELASVPLVSLHKMRLTGLDQAMKAVLDYTLSAAALVILSPLFLVLALFVRLDSPGPVFYRRRVMGANGRQFDAFKFRTMVVGGDALIDQDPALKAEFGKNHKLRHDPRITRAGGFLRKTSLDELPQLLNVLRGEMSLVGPRMICLEEMARYEQAGMNLLTVKPGITGLWQVSGRSELPYEERVRLDMYYIRNWSIWLDLHLLLQTIPCVLSRRGAY